MMKKYIHIRSCNQKGLTAWRWRRPSLDVWDIILIKYIVAD